MDIIWNSSKVAEGLAITSEAHAGAITALKELLDDYHGIPRSALYYDLIAGDWLAGFVHVTYAAWQRVVSGESLREEYAIRVAPDLWAFTQDTLDPNFHDYWQSAVERLLAAESPEGWHFAQGEACIAIGRRNWRKRILASTFGSNRPAMVFCYPYVKCSRREWVTTLWRWRRWAKWDDFDFPVNFSCRLDQDWRRARSAVEVPVLDFSGLLRALLPLHIPVALLEGFASLRDTVLELKLWRPRALYTANALHGHLAFKVLAAEWRMEGTMLLNHQHGGGYGIDRVHTLEDYESRVADRFYSWGWQRSDRPVWPMSVPSPARFRGTRHRVLLMCCSFPGTVYRLHFQPMPGTIATMENSTIAFLSALPVNADLLIRLTSSPRDVKRKASLQAVVPWAGFDETRPNVFQRFAESRLVVHSYLGTSWLETLALDIPTVCFFDPDTSVFRAEAQPYIEAMEQVGIVHRSGSDAARFVAGVMTDPQGWWRKAEVQEARQAFVRQYANFSPDWAVQWEAEFRQWVE